ncbi:MAG: pimeloyl-CoA dehydrogenase large subunit [Bradyrhizobium sp.]|nr:pimeloyl-CoA dehydrogenase large subunit [Bradyrhizobium sp.]
MDLSFTPDELRFRKEVRQFLRDHLPDAIAGKVRDGVCLTKADMEQWHAILQSRGWLASHWPKEYGGPGWSVVERFIFDDEAAIAHAPRILPYGLKMLGPVLIKYGSEAQKAYWLPRILDGTDWWCQGYSEPGAGSDLAAVKTLAVREGDAFVVNGQKTWTSLGQYADMIFCLVRTDPAAKKQEGISFLLIDMRSPGVEVRPIRLLDGEHEVNEVFFTDVRVPAKNLVGEENRGWTYAKYLLSFERTNLAGIGFSVAALEQLKDFAARQCWNGRPLIDDPAFSARLARVEIDLRNLRTTNLRVLVEAARNASPGSESSMLKVKGSEIRQEIASLTRRAMGIFAQPFLPQALAGDSSVPPVGPREAVPAAASYFNNRKLSIFGGSNEVQKNIIAKSILEL